MDELSSYFPPLNDLVAADRSVSFPAPVICATKTNTSVWIGHDAGYEAILVMYGEDTSTEAEYTEAGYDVLHPSSLRSIIGGPTPLNLSQPVSPLCNKSTPGCTPKCNTFKDGSKTYLSLLKRDILPREFDYGNGFEERWVIQPGGSLSLDGNFTYLALKPRYFVGFVAMEGMLYRMDTFEVDCRNLFLETLTPPFERVSLCMSVWGFPRVVYQAENHAAPLLYVRDSHKGGTSTVLNFASKSVQEIKEIPNARKRGDMYSFIDYTGVRVVAVPLGKGVGLYSLESGEEHRRLCCAKQKILAVRSIVLMPNKTSIYTVGDGGYVEKWRADTEELQFPVRYDGEVNETLEVFANTENIVVIRESGVELFSADPKQLQAESKANAIGYNIGMFLVMMAFIFFSLVFKQNFGNGSRRWRASIGTPEKVAGAAEDEEEPSLKSRCKSCCLGFWSRVKVFFGIKISLKHYNVSKLPDYNPNRLNLIYAFQRVVCFVPLLALRFFRGRISKDPEAAEKVSLCGVTREERKLPEKGCLSWLNMYTTHFILVTYLIFVAVTFSPNVFGSYVGPAAGPSNGQVCADKELKLMTIKENLLEFANVSAGEIQVSLHKQRPKDMLAVITAENYRTKPNSVFPNFPNYTKCGSIIDAKRDELIRQIEKDDCRFESKTVRLLDRVSHRYFFPRYIFTAHTSPFELPPRHLNRRQCPIDPSLLTDVDQLRDIVDGYIAPQARTFDEVDQVVEDAYSELIKTLIFQANFAADMYIFYVCACLLVRPPLRLGKSRTLVLVKRSFLNWQQIPFVLTFTVLAYVLPILLENFDLEKLLEQWNKFLANAGADMCYVQPSFIASIADTVFKTCEEIQELEDEFHAIGQEAAKISRDASAYFLCVEPHVAVRQALANLELMANETLSVPFAAQLCDDIGRKVLLEQFSSPSEASVSVSGGESFFKAIGVLLQLFGKFILVNFGLSLTKTLDPLSFHGGKVEVIPNASFQSGSANPNTQLANSNEQVNPMHATVEEENGNKQEEGKGKGENGEELVLPPAADVADFLRKTYAFGMFYHFALVVAFLANLAAVLHSQIANARGGDVALFWVSALFAVGVFCLIVRNDRKRRAEKEKEKEKEKDNEEGQMEDERCEP